MRDEMISHVFSVRGRPVGFRPGRFGGDLVAIERGYFPVSPTGYRSLAGHFGLTGPADPSAISPEFLETLAQAQDRERQATLARLRRTPRADADYLTNFIGVSINTAQAVQEGIFAPERDRAALWGGAYRLLCLIDSDRRFQPASTAPAWTRAQCAAALARERELLGLIRQLAAGEFPTSPPARWLSLQAYFDLPPKPSGEPSFALPAITEEFAIDLPVSSADADDDYEPDDPLPVADEEESEDANQLTLF